MGTNECKHNLQEVNIRKEIPEAFYKIRPDFERLPLSQLLETTDEDNRKLYSEMLEILVRAKADGGYGYCESCAKKSIEIFCTPPVEIDYSRPLLFPKRGILEKLKNWFIETFGTWHCAE